MEYVPLRPYQERLIATLREDMRDHKHIALRLQQGGGKSYLIASMAERSVRNGNKVLVLSHRRQITRQNAGAHRWHYGLYRYAIITKQTSVLSCYLPTDTSHSAICAHHKCRGHVLRGHVSNDAVTC